jgi:peptidoglycan/LPS O-acetylase OafA/YrhL
MSATQRVDTAPASRAGILCAKPRVHLRFLDGFRGVAALYVVLYHARLQVWPDFSGADGPRGLTRALTGWLGFGELAVTCFIAVSGFCLMLPVLGNHGILGPGGTRRFFFRRARRILPAYYMALFLSIAIVAGLIAAHGNNLAGRPLPITNGGILSHLALVQNFQIGTLLQINGPLWSIAVECQICLFFPLLILARSRFGMVTVLGVAYLMTLVLQSRVQETQYKGLMPLYYFVFLLGMFAAEVAVGLRKRAFIWMAGAMSALLLGMFLFPGLRFIADINVVVGFWCFSILIVCTQWPRSWVSRVAGWSPIATIGTFSYSLYLLHGPLQQLLWFEILLPMKLGKVLTFATGLTVGTGLIVAFAFEFHLMFERPFFSTFLKASTPLEIEPALVQSQT